jgi:acylpyruvate hydrolase
MRLATVRLDGGATAAAVLDGEELAIVAGGDGSAAFADVGALLAAGEPGRSLAEAAAGSSSERLPLDRGRLAPPVLAPAAIVCVGLNYRSHITEMGRDIPEHPTLFGKLARSLADPVGEIALPLAEHRFDYEGELAVVIGRTATRVSADEALAAVGGYTVFNDVTARDLQRRTLQWFAGKNCEASSPLGPWLSTPDELPDGPGEMRVTVNGERRQQATFDDLVFGVADLIADISAIFTLHPGDVIATGTPGGVGHAAEPPLRLQDGDSVAVEIDGIGGLESRFRDLA